MNKVPCGIYGHAYIYWWNHLGMLLLCWGGRNCGSEVNNEQSEFGASNPRWKHHGTQLAHWCANTMIFYMWMEQHGIDRSGKTVVWSNVTGTTGWWTMELTNQLDISLIQIWFWLCFDDWDSHVFSLSSPSFLKVRAKDFL